MTSNKTAWLTLCLILGTAQMAHAVVIASTDFNGRTVSGSTASNLTWVLNGVADPGDLTAQMNPDGLFNTADAQNRFAVNRNIHNEGPWLFDVELAVSFAATKSAPFQTIWLRS